MQSTLSEHFGQSCLSAMTLFRHVCFVHDVNVSSHRPQFSAVHYFFLSGRGGPWGRGGELTEPIPLKSGFLKLLQTDESHAAPGWIRRQLVAFNIPDRSSDLAVCGGVQEMNRELHKNRKTRSPKKCKQLIHYDRVGFADSSPKQQGPDNCANDAMAPS